ncbi:MAG: 1-deoxy-D-xylulose-5-phosphate reductoisomerase [Planctomycetes bacterium]|nr:1-deoxy-D-xylulose-5-phosphate reductoisomerase [Planctomycetota bacterium]
MRSLVVLGSTGSIGTQTLEVVRARPGTFAVTGLAAGSNWALAVEQAREFGPRWLALSDAEAAERARAALPRSVEVLSGAHAAVELCERAEYELAVHGMVGARGLAPSRAVLERGRKLALANKESLVVAGQELMALARSRGGRILPVDSELCAIFQCLGGDDVSRVRRVLLTASGGPFRDSRPDELARMGPDDALRHPTWTMGRRISVGSATLMNKALEVLEVHHLFGLERARIEVLIHRQSVVHSMVEFVDGSVLAQLGPPDMKGPLHYCMHHPERVDAPLRGFDFELFARLTFEPVDPALFPSLALGFRAIEQGGDSGAVLNAADEVAVEAFLKRRIRFTDIERINRLALERRPARTGGIDALLASDRDARALALAEIDRISPPAAR